MEGKASAHFLQWNIGNILGYNTGISLWIFLIRMHFSETLNSKAD